MKELLKKAREALGRFSLPGYHKNYAGSTAAALITKDGNIYTGINAAIVGSSSIGVCAEHSAILEMLKNRETEIKMIVAVSDNDKGIRTPCGACRELMLQIDDKNAQTMVAMTEDTTLPLSELMPHHWIIKKE